LQNEGRPEQDDRRGRGSDPANHPIRGYVTSAVGQESDDSSGAKRDRSAIDAGCLIQIGGLSSSMVRFRADCLPFAGLLSLDILGMPKSK